MIHTVHHRNFFKSHEIFLVVASSIPSAKSTVCLPKVKKEPGIGVVFCGDAGNVSPPSIDMSRICPHDFYKVSVKTCNIKLKGGN